MRVLIVKTSAAGDIVQAFAAAELIKAAYPHAEIDWVAEESLASLPESHPVISHVHTLATKRWRKNPFAVGNRLEFKAFLKNLRSKVYDVAFDLQGNIKSGIIMGMVKAQEKVGFARKTCPEWPNILFTHYRYNAKSKESIYSDYCSLVMQHFDIPYMPPREPILLNVPSVEKLELQKAIKKIWPQQGAVKILICPGSRWPNKQLPKETWKVFLNKLAKKIGRDVEYTLVWGSEDEKVEVEEIASGLDEKFIVSSQILEKLSLPALQRVMSSADLVISVDSLALHLAALGGVKTFSIFGASSSEKYAPRGEGHAHFQGVCPYGRAFEKRCPILRTCPTGLCIRGVTADTLIQAIDIDGLIKR